METIEEFKVQSHNDSAEVSGVDSERVRIRGSNATKLFKFRT